MTDVTELAVAAWRMEKWLNNLSADHKVAAKSALGTIKRYLNESGIEVEDLAGQKFEEGTPVRILNNESKTTEKEKLYIIEMVRPVIRRKGEVLQEGQVILGDEIKIRRSVPVIWAEDEAEFSGPAPVGEPATAPFGLSAPGAAVPAAADQLAVQAEAAGRMTAEQILEMMRAILPEAVAQTVNAAVQENVPRMVKETLPGALHDSIASTADAAMKDMMSDIINTSANMISQAAVVSVSQNLEAALNQAMDSSVKAAVSETLSSRINEAVEESVNALVPQAVTASVERAVGDTVRDALPKTLPAEEKKTPGWLIPAVIAGVQIILLIMLLMSQWSMGSRISNLETAPAAAETAAAQTEQPQPEPVEENTTKAQEESESEEASAEAESEEETAPAEPETEAPADETTEAPTEAPTAAETPAETGPIVYTVKSGDTIKGICRKLGLDFDRISDSIQALNPGLHIDRLDVGQVIYFPR